MKKAKLTEAQKRLKKAKKELEVISHLHIRKRDSLKDGEIGGICCSCGKFCVGSDFQAGHYEPSGSCGALLRYHPHNMHGQGGFCCNLNFGNSAKAQRTANGYTFFMIKKYGRAYVEKLRALKQKSIKADVFFYEKMVELYKEGNERKIINYLGKQIF